MQNFKNITTLFLLLVFGLVRGSYAQQKDSTATKSEYKGMVFEVGEGRTLKLGFTNQVWVRYAFTNPGTTVFGDSKNEIFDIGLRRTRITLGGSPIDKLNVFMQMGMNNFNYISQRNAGFYFHDAVADYAVIKNMSIGAGLTAWGGFSRFSTPSISSILGVDAPLFAQATNGATDQFLRKLSVYTKGELNKFSYNLAVSKPMAIQQSGQYQPISTASTFSDNSPKPQWHSYIQYTIFDKENHNSPYYKGTYHGDKKVLTFGAGFLFQNNAMHRLSDQGDTLKSNLMILSADMFYDVPTKNGGAISVYAAYYNYDFGKGYLRNIGAMNPANGNSDPTIVNGAGTAFPQIGTGNIGYIQGGYLIPARKRNKDAFRLMPYGSLMLAGYDALDEAMLTYDMGLNVLVDGHRTKFTLAYQNRPVYQNEVVTDTQKIISRKGLLIGQFQISI